MTFETILKIIIAFSNNIFNLLVIVFFYSASNYNVKKRGYAKHFIAGIVIGLSAFFIMYTPLRLTDGLIFDTRSILFTISGVFFGFIPTLIGVATSVT